MNSFLLRVLDPRGPADGFLVELREDQALSDLHAAIRSALGLPEEAEYAFDLAGGEAPDFDDPDFVLDEKVAALFPLREVIDTLGGRIWHRGGRGTATEIVPERIRVAYPRAAYPRRVAPPGGAPAVRGDESEASTRLRSEARFFAHSMDELVRRGTLGNLEPGSDAPEPLAAQEMLTKLLEWTGGDRRRLAAVEMLAESNWDFWLRSWITGEWPRLGRAGEAAEILSRWATIARRDDALARRALVLAKGGRANESIAQAEEVLASGTRDGWAIFLAGQALDAAGEASRAEAVYRELLAEEEIPAAFEAGVIERLLPLLERSGRSVEAAELVTRLAHLRAELEREPAELAADSDAIDDEDDDELLGDAAEEGLDELEAAPADLVGRDERPREGEEAALWRTLRARLLEFASRPEHAARIAAALTDAMDEDLARFTLPQILAAFAPRSAAASLVDWVLLDAADAEGRSLARLFLESATSSLEAVERSVLQRALAEPASLYSVQESRPGAGVTLVDLPRGGTRRIDDPRLPAILGEGDLIATRVLELDGRPRVAGGRLEFDAEDAAELMSALTQAHDDYIEVFPGSGWDDVLREHFDLFPAFLAYKAREATREPEAPLSSPEEDLVRARAIYRVRDLGALRRALDRSASFRPLEKETSWAWQEAGEVGRTLGRVEIEGRQLALETISAESLARGKTLLAGVAGILLDHVADEFVDPFSDLA